MPIKVLLADDSDAVRSAIRRILEEDSRINIVGEAATFERTVQMIGDLKPEVLLLDLHMAEKREFTPDLVKAQLGCVCTLAISFSNDDEANQLAESYGAVSLLDKMKLYSDMIPAIMSQFEGKIETASKTRLSRTLLSKRTFHKDSHRSGPNLL
jgi:DNA-binding NarL/FixJ family response regulator